MMTLVLNWRNSEEEMVEMAEMEREAFQEREGGKEREGPLNTREHVGLWDQWGRKVSQERREREALWGCLELLELRKELKRRE